MCKPISTNAPKEATFLTVPFNCMPTFKSSIVRTSFLKIGAGASVLGSSPGFFNSLIISLMVYSSWYLFISVLISTFSRVSLNLSVLISLMSKFKSFNIWLVNS